MDHSSLATLAKSGLSAFPPSKIGDLASWCWDIGEATGDARYCSLARTMGLIDDLFEEFGAVGIALIGDIDRLLSDQLPAVIEAETAEEGSRLARILREQVLIAISNRADY